MINQMYIYDIVIFIAGILVGLMTIANAKLLKSKKVIKKDINDKANDYIFEQLIQVLGKFTDGVQSALATIITSIEFDYKTSNMSKERLTMYQNILKDVEYKMYTSIKGILHNTKNYNTNSKDYKGIQRGIHDVENKIKDSIVSIYKLIDAYADEIENQGGSKMVVIITEENKAIKELEIAEMLKSNPKLIANRINKADGSVEVQINEAVDFTM